MVGLLYLQYGAAEWDWIRGCVTFDSPVDLGTDWLRKRREVVYWMEWIVCRSEREVGLHSGCIF